MKYRSGNEVRQLFLDYFKSKGHMIEPGASLVPVNDPTLLWINSGVAALKKYFDGSVKPDSKRITNAQKSIRTNDIENVGKTARHHTFFEMLGNFSIGDYFKVDAIQYAWEFLTSEEYIGMEKEKMYVTVHPTDDEAYRIWIDIIGLDPKRILKSEENYWQIGEGPCGPNSEIYYDRGLAYDPENIGEALFFEERENDRYLEVWNVVFSQYDGKEGVDRKDYKELPQRNIDTGMGLERLVSIVQNCETNFDTDLFLPVIRAVEKQAKYPYSKSTQMAYRVIADHIRTVTFALADGALFSNEGRGYVLRRILRRAVRYGIKLGIEDAFMYQLVKDVAQMMSPFYAYVNDKVEYIEKLVKAEELRFHKTLNDGEQLLKIELSKTSNKTLVGETVFKLYDTFGFPAELTKEIAEELGYTIDIDGFKLEMNKQRERARAAIDKTESMKAQSIDLMNCTIESNFIGYDIFEIETKVVALFKNGISVESLDDEGQIILEETPFYAESGGQIADTGFILFDQGEALVLDVQKAPHKQNLHSIKLNFGELKLNDTVVAKIDRDRRQQITTNHSSAHLLQSALKKIVGEHIQQAGSYVSDEYMRFDFTHFEKVSDEQIKEIEQLVNQNIFAKRDVSFEYLPIEEAKASGAMALFSEKYDRVVRVVTMGEFSKELCGGCHVRNTQEMGLFKIVSEESIGSGIRRITAKTGLSAYHDFLSYQEQLETIASLFKANSIHKIEERVNLSLEDLNDTKQQLGQAKQKLANMESKLLKNEFVDHNGLSILIKRIDQNADHLRLLIESLKKDHPESLIFFASSDQSKALFVAYCGPSIIKAGYKAGDLVKEAAVLTQGNGGGRPDFAQAGGKEVSKLNDAIELIRKKVM
jgi:alanyl-tRNA synthetase